MSQRVTAFPRADGSQAPVMGPSRNSSWISSAIRELPEYVALMMKCDKHLLALSRFECVGWDGGSVSMIGAGGASAGAKRTCNLPRNGLLPKLNQTVPAGARMPSLLGTLLWISGDQLKNMQCLAREWNCLARSCKRLRLGHQESPAPPKHRIVGREILG